MDLFAGIGGFSLAAGWAGWETQVMVEWNPYCQAVLKKNFPNATIFGDIKQFDGTAYAGQIDIVTGGFHCQPFSHAGKREGKTDDRYLWPEMLRIIREVKPAWVVGENVAGILTMDGGRVLAGILADLENEGYSPEIYIIPAIGIGAPHRRDRVWIVANTCNDTATRQRQYSRGLLPDAAPKGFNNENCITTYSDKQRLEKRKVKPENIESKQPTIIGDFWSEHWYKVATRICRMDDGFSDGMDGDIEIPAKATKGKAHRLEALGNAIVPQVAYQIFMAINEFEK